MNPTAVAKAEMKNPQYHALFTATHTIKVTPTAAPITTLSNKQLKNVASALASFGSFWLNWSAPSAGKAPRTPPDPIASRYSEV